MEVTEAELEAAVCYALTAYSRHDSYREVRIVRDRDIPRIINEVIRSLEAQTLARRLGVAV